MKADIPDSIIISRDEDGALHHSYWTTDQQLVPFEATEFIRKDKIREMVMYARNMSQTPDAAIRNWDLLIQEIDEL